MTSTTSTAALVPELRARARRQRPRAAGDAEIGTPHAPVATSASPMIARVAELIGTARPSPMPATAVLTPTTSPRPFDERAAGVAGVERGVGLDHVVDDAHRRCPPARAASGRARTPRPPSPSPAKPCGLPIATTSWPTRRRSASPSVGGHEVARLGAHHREVGERVAARRSSKRELAPVHERGAALARRARRSRGRRSARSRRGSARRRCRRPRASARGGCPR